MSNLDQLKLITEGKFSMANIAIWHPTGSALF